MEKEKQKDPDLAEAIQHQASYHLGRLLYERKQDLGTAVDELRKAQKHDPDDVRISYYLGQAIRSLVEKETLAEASEALQKYIDKGAPLGQMEEVIGFLKSRNSLR
jgi:Flp pilus assembly protein TadD